MASVQALINSGLVDSLKYQYRNIPYNIPDKYFVLIADYIDSISQLDPNQGLFLDPIEVAKTLPSVLTSIQEANLGVIHGRTDADRIVMNSNMNYEMNKLYFFHELTHALQTRWVDGHEECSFYDGKTGMFLTEGATQYTAEILYHVSNGTNIRYRVQNGVVRGHPEHTPYSPLSEYQINGNILMLLSSSLGLPLNQVLALGYRRDGRGQIKELYESFPGNEGKFEEFMLDLEKIYSVDKLIMAGYGSRLQGGPLNIQMQDGTIFVGNIQMQGELINKVERELAANFIANNDIDYILKNYQKISNYLTTSQLQTEFLNSINSLARETIADFIGNHDENYIMEHYQEILDILPTSQMKQEFMNAVNEVSSMKEEQPQVQESTEELQDYERRKQEYEIISSSNRLMAQINGQVEIERNLEETKAGKHFR